MRNIASLLVLSLVLAACGPDDSVPPADGQPPGCSVSVQGRRLPWQLPIQANASQRYVYTEDELIMAIGDANAAFQDDLTGKEVPSDRSIVIAGVIILTKGSLRLQKPISIVGSGIGWLKSDANPIIEISTINAHDIRLQGLRIESTSTAANVKAISAPSGSLNNLVVEDSDIVMTNVTGVPVAISFAGDSTLCHLADNRFGGNVTGAFRHCDITANKFQSNDLIITIGGTFTSVTGNQMNGGNITTTASNGGNILAANTNVGTKTLHADDLDDDVHGLTTIAYAASIALDFSSATPVYKTVTLAGNLTLTSSNLAGGRQVSLRIVGDGIARTITCPAGWRFVGSAPITTLAANKIAVVALASYGTTDANVVGAFNAEP